MTKSKSQKMNLSTPPFFFAASSFGSSMSAKSASVHCPMEQLFDAQSPFVKHRWPMSQSAGHEAPQSMSGSAQFAMPSSQRASWQVPPMQTRLAQSSSREHDVPGGQPTLQLPPQSVPTSPGSRQPLLQRSKGSEIGRASCRERV